jgi:hypothetical protein
MNPALFLGPDSPLMPKGIIDLSLNLNENTPVYPGGLPLKLNTRQASPVCAVALELD